MKKKQLDVVHVAPPFYPLDENIGYGGIERVIATLRKEQELLGLRSGVLAPSDSKVEGLIPMVPSIGFTTYSGPSPTYTDELFRQFLKLEGIAKVVQWAVQHPTTVLHLHDDNLLPFLKFMPNPLLMTLHSEYTEFWQSRNHPELVNASYNLVAISQRHKAIYQEHKFHILDVVYNGIDVERFPFEKRKDNYLLTLGIIATHKGQKNAIDLAKATNHDLIIAGNVGNQAYFDEHVKPHITYDLSSIKDKYGTASGILDLDSKTPRIIYVGMVNDEQKKPLFAHAKAFLMPIEWEEPFGLVVVEALATGTPVLAYKRGSMPELVHDGVTGYLSENASEMAKHLEKVSALSPEFCRREALQKFGSRAMAKKYMQLYTAVAQEQLTLPLQTS